MRTVFADTYYFLALLDTREGRHRQASEAALDPHTHLVTTEWVLVEFGTAYSQPKDRADFVRICRSLANNPRVKVVFSDPLLFQRGLDLYARRKDKEWSMTDCISFVVMEEMGLREALTGDRHFEQAGFKALLA
jgi:predicted nucleic acid-binding protein